MRTDRAALLVAGALSLLLSLLLLGPALMPGFVLAYDMVWVPDLALRPDFVGIGSALPRAVPADAVVAVLDEAVPGSILQKLVLLGALVGAGIGHGRLLLGLGWMPVVVGVTFAVWNPFVVERLWLGHWTMLVAYAVVPWVLPLAARARRQGRIPAALPGLAVLGSLSAGAGLLVAVAILATGIRRGGAGLRLTLVVVAANAPWVMAGFLHRAHATSSAEAADAFATRSEGILPLPFTVLGLGGIWNSEVVPASRETVAAVLGLVVVVALAVVGARSWWREPGVIGRRGPLVAAGVGWGLALVSGWQPSLLGWLAAEVPGGGLVRDGSRLLGLAAPLLVLLVGHGVNRLLRAVREPGLRPILAGVGCLLLMASLPDPVWGGTGRLRAVDYPQSWAEVRAEVGDADGRDVLVLPFTSYRAPDWNGGRKVLDPLGRFLIPDFVASDDLYVAGDRIPGEDPRARVIGAALDRSPDPERLEAVLAREGIGVVVTDLASGGRTPSLTGPVRRIATTTLVEIPDAERVAAPWSWRLLMAGAWGVWGAVPLGFVLARRRRRDLGLTGGR